AWYIAFGGVMAIALAFIDFIVPIAAIRDKFPGGWTQCLKDHKASIGGRVWYDAHLFRDGAMSPRDIESLVRRWASLSFEPTERRDERQIWKDFCVVESMRGGSTLACEWLGIGSDGRSAYLKGPDPGQLAGRQR